MKEEEIEQIAQEYEQGLYRGGKGGGGGKVAAGPGSVTAKADKLQKREEGEENRALIILAGLKTETRQINPRDDEGWRRYGEWVEESIEGEDYEPIKAEIEEERSRSSGAGGQNVQKNETKVMLKHKTSGNMAVVQNERSLSQNQAEAVIILKRRLNEHLLSWRQLKKLKKENFSIKEVVGSLRD